MSANASSTNGSSSAVNKPVGENTHSKKRERSSTEGSTDATSAVAPHRKGPAVAQHYFAVDDIVWIRPQGLPFWPAEVRSVDNKKNTVTCALFSPPALAAGQKRPPPVATTTLKADAVSLNEEQQHAVPLTTSSSVTEEEEVLVTSQTKRVFFFDKLQDESSLLSVVEDRLDRKKHDVSAYEFAFVAAVRRANSLVRIPLSPAMLTPFPVCGVGIVHSFMRTHVSAPRQPSTKEFLPQSAVIMLKPGLENAVRDLQGFERIWVLFHFSYAVGMKQSERNGAENATGFKTMIVPPRDTVARGVFATRSPHRPNGIGLSCVRLVKVQGLEVHIADHDLLHGTPVLDIKPYLPFCDAHPNAKAGWVQELDERGGGLADHRGVADASIAVHRNFDQHRQGALVYSDGKEESAAAEVVTKKLTRHA